MRMRKDFLGDCLTRSAVYIEASGLSFGCFFFRIDGCTAAAPTAVSDLEPSVYICSYPSYLVRRFLNASLLVSAFVSPLILFARVVFISGIWRCQGGLGGKRKSSVSSFFQAISTKSSRTRKPKGLMIF